MLFSPCQNATVTVFLKLETKQWQVYTERPKLHSQIYLEKNNKVGDFLPDCEILQSGIGIIDQQSRDKSLDVNYIYNLLMFSRC